MEAIVACARERVAGGVAGAEDDGGEDRLPRCAQARRHGPLHRLHGAAPEEAEAQGVQELKRHQFGGAPRMRDERPANRGAGESDAEEDAQRQAAEKRRKGEQREHLGEHADRQSSAGHAGGQAEVPHQHPEQ